MLNAEDQPFAMPPPIPPIESIREEQKRILTQNKTSRFGVQGSLYLNAKVKNPLRSDNLNLPDTLQGIALSQYQKNLNATDKTQLPVLKRELNAEKVKLQKIYDSYDIRADSEETKADVSRIVTDLIQFLKVHVTSLPNGRSLQGFNGTDFSSQAELLNAMPWTKFTFAASILAN